MQIETELPKALQKYKLNITSDGDTNSLIPFPLHPNKKVVTPSKKKNKKVVKTFMIDIIIITEYN